MRVSFSLFLELRVDATFSSLLAQASEEIRRRVISVLTHGDNSSSSSGGVASADNKGGGVTGATPLGEDGEADGPSVAAVGATSATGDTSTRGAAGLASVVELQEQEIAGLREELSEALSRVPRGGGEGGGVSALEEALKNQVRCLQAQPIAAPMIMVHTEFDKVQPTSVEYQTYGNSSTM